MSLRLKNLLWRAFKVFLVIFIIAFAWWFGVYGGIEFQKDRDSKWLEMCAREVMACEDEVDNAIARDNRLEVTPRCEKVCDALNNVLNELDVNVLRATSSFEDPYGRCGCFFSNVE